MDICNHSFNILHYAIDTTFILNDELFVVEIMIINEFSIFMSKCEIDGISVLKVMEVTLCVMQNINLTPDSKF